MSRGRLKNHKFHQRIREIDYVVCQNIALKITIFVKQMEELITNFIELLCDKIANFVEQSCNKITNFVD